MLTNRRIPTVAFGLAATLAAISLGQQRAAAPGKDGGAVRAFLRTYIDSNEIAPASTTRVTIGSVKTEHTADLQLAYISGRGWCGTGGCMLLILERAGPSFRVLGKVSVVQLPVRVLGIARNGYPDIGVYVQGGGIERGYEAVLSFDGVAYPGNPTAPPARRLERSRGSAVISTASPSVPLYK
jgi:hypothetical protein